jgi:hypothetical protein
VLKKLFTGSSMPGARDWPFQIADCRRRISDLRGSEIWNLRSETSERSEDLEQVLFDRLNSLDQARKMKWLRHVLVGA